MIKKCAAKALLLILTLSLFVPITFGAQIAQASNSVEASLFGSAIIVDEQPRHLRAFVIRDVSFVNIFEVALLLSDTEKQFFPTWQSQMTHLRLVSGVPYTAIGFNTSRSSPAVTTAIPASVDVTHDGELSAIGAYRILGDIFLSLRDIASKLDFFVDDNRDEGTIIIDTERNYVPGAIRRGQLDPDKPMVALTFDDGPHDTHTLAIVDILYQHGSAATFYVIGSMISGREDILIRAHELGNEIANHTWSHPRLSETSVQNIRTQLGRTNNAIYDTIGIRPNQMRPPFGAFNNNVNIVSRDLGLSVLMWSIDPLDWLHQNPQRTFNHVMEEVRDGDIVVLHDTHEATVRAMELLIPALIERGFQIVTVSELFYYRNIEMQPGVTYRHARR